MPLDCFRVGIDSVDRQILELLAKRNEISLQVAEYKRANGLPLKQFEREKELFEARKRLALELGLDPVFVEALFRLIIEDSLNIQGLRP